MAGSDPRFNAAAFRDAIHFAMNMGLPNTTNERATFRWSTTHTYTYEDPNDRPYNWTATPTTTVTHDDVQVPVAVEFAIRSSQTTGDTVVGKFDQARAILTALDEDYTQVAGANLVVLGGNTYYVDFVEPPVGLFDVTIYRIHCTARDES